MTTPISTDSVLLAPQTVTDGATVTANLDCQGAAYASIKVAYSAEEGTDATAASLSLLQSDDTVVTNFATVAAVKSVASSTAAQVTTYNVDLRGKKRYLRLSHTSGTGTGSNLIVSAIASLGREGDSPAGTAFADNGVSVG